MKNRTLSLAVIFTCLASLPSVVSAGDMILTDPEHIECKFEKHDGFRLESGTYLPGWWECQIYYHREKVYVARDTYRGNAEQAYRQCNELKQAAREKKAMFRLNFSLIEEITVNRYWPPGFATLVKPVEFTPVD